MSFRTVTRPGRRRFVVALLLCAAGAWLPAPLVGVAQAQPAAASQNTGAANQQFAVAAGFHNRQAWDLAADEWQKFITGFPQDDRLSLARHYLGVCRLQLKDFAGAADVLGKLVAADPKFDQIASSKLYLGMAQFHAARQGKEEQFAAAEKTLAGVLRDHPQGKHVPQAVYFLAETLYAENKKAEAEPLYRRFVEEFPDDALLPDALYALGFVLEDLQKSDQAQAAYAQFVERFPKHALRTEVDMHRAELLVAAKDFAAAEQLFASCAAAPGYADADYALLSQAGCLYGLQQYASAAALYDELPRRFPRSERKVEAQLASGRNRFYAEQWEAAATQLRPLATSEGKLGAEAAHWTARALLKMKQPAEAEKLLDDVLKRAAPKEFAAQLALDRADSLYDQPQRRDDALKAYKKIAEQSPQDPLAEQAAYLAALTALDLARNDEARKLADAYLKDRKRIAFRGDVLYIKAEALLRAGDNGGAVTAYDELLTSDSQHADRPKWIVRRAYALARAGRHDAVIKSLAGEIDGLGDARLASEARQLLGISRHETKDYTGAIADLESSLKLDPQRPGADEVLLALAEAHRLAGDAKAATDTLERLAATYPNSPLLDSAFYRRGESAYAAGDFVGAEKAYQRVVADFSKSQFAPYARYGLAWTALGRDDAKAAAAAIDTLLSGEVPGELAAKARYARALALEQLGKYQPAIDDLNVFLKTKPAGAERSEALYWLGRCQMGLAQSDEALATFTQLLNADPRFAGASKVLYEIGWIHKKAKRGKESAAAFARLAKENPASPQAPEALFHVGEEAYARKDYDTAIDAFYDAREKADSKELAEKSAYNLGLTYFHKNNFAKAEEWFRFELDKYGDGELAQDARFREAEAQFKQKKYKEALAGFRLVKNPKEADLNVLALLHGGQCAAQLENWKEAETMLDAAAQRFPQSPFLPEINYERAWAKQNLGREEEALKLYEEVTAQTQDVTAARARFMIGEIYFARKNHAEAVRHFFRAAVGYNYPEWQARAHFEAGRCFEVLGKLDQAKKSYQEIVDHFGQFEEAPLAKKRLEALEQTN